MKREIALLACVAAIGVTGCKKKQQQAPQPAEKTAEQPPTNTPPPEPPKPATAEEKVKFYQDCFAAVNSQNWDKLTKCYTDDATSEAMDSGMPTLTGPADIVAKGVKMWATAFPDMKLTPTLILQNGDKVASVVVITGTQKGAFQGPMGEVPPTGKKIGMMIIHMVQFAPDKLAAQKEWVFSNQAKLIGQLGLMKGMPVPPVMDMPTGQPTVVMAKDDDTEKANLAAYKAASDAFNKHDMKGLAASWAPDAVMHNSAGPDTSVKKEMAFWKELFKGVPDAKSETTDAWAAGDYVVAIRTSTGTNTGPMPSMKIKKPTGKSVTFHEADVARFKDGKNAENWSVANELAIAEQMGMMKMPAAGGAGGKAMPAKGGKAMKGDKKAPAKTK